jgi:hypothetical protein
MNVRLQSDVLEQSNSTLQLVHLALAASAITWSTQGSSPAAAPHLPLRSLHSLKVGPNSPQLRRYTGQSDNSTFAG